MTTSVRRAPTRGRLRRLLGSMLGQGRRSLRCPERPRLDGLLALVTGATGGIGLELAHGLTQRGAELVIPCRSRAKGDELIDQLVASGAPRQKLHRMDLDLEDLDSVLGCVAHVERIAAGRPLDVLVENAGIWPQRYRETVQGHEIAFGVNVLAHFVLRQELLRRGVLRDGRVLIVTGDIYVLQSACTPTYRWHGALGGMRAYCRSKLGNLWIAAELARRFPALTVLAVHPGVVATGLGGDVGGLASWVKDRLLLDPAQGAQAPLFCATQPGLQSGGYYHNVFGRVDLPPGDPARDGAAARQLWELCASLAPPSKA